MAEAIDAIRWPVGAADFTILPKKKVNGVPAIKEAFIFCLEDKYRWSTEFRYKIEGQLRVPGPVDVAKTIRDTGKMLAVEWETGNIASSHRALNKMAIGIRENILCGGILVLPSRKLYNFLTDRVGSFQELSPYFPVWKNLDVAKQGILAVIEIEHDKESADVPRLGKGTDGWALLKRPRKTRR